jgi:hypothetical protein
VTQAPHLAQVSVRRDDHAALSLNRLDHHARVRVHDLGEAGCVAVGDVRHLREQRPERILVQLLRGERERAHGLAVKTAGRRDQPVLPMGSGQLDRGLGRLGAGVHEMHSAQALWRDPGERLGRGRRGRLQQQPGGQRVFPRLRDHGRNDGRVGVAEQEYPVAAAVQVASPVGVMDVGAV